MKTNAPQLKRIEIPVFDSTDETVMIAQVTARTKEEGSLSLSVVTLNILLKSFFIATQRREPEVTEYKLFCELTEILLATKDSCPKEELLKVVFNRQEVELFKVWLTSRIAHCEMEKDNKSDLFVADTYIQMKYLYLNLQVWLMGEIVG